MRGEGGLTHFLTRSQEEQAASWRHAAVCRRVRTVGGRVGDIESEKGGGGAERSLRVGLKPDGVLQVDIDPKPRDIQRSPLSLKLSLKASERLIFISGSVTGRSDIDLFNRSD